MRCPVLTLAMLLPGGEDMDLSDEEEVSFPIGLPLSYAISGTDIAYGAGPEQAGATRIPRARGPNRR
eukprot:3847741-Rhodomonas_salina.1